MKMKLAAILRRLADHLAPPVPGDCGSGSTWVGVADMPYVSGGIVDGAIDLTRVTDSQIIANPGFESGPPGIWAWP